MEPAFTPASQSRWYTRPWGIIGILLLTILVIGTIGFIALIGFYSFKISQGQGQEIAPVKKGGFTKNTTLSGVAATKKITPADILSVISSANPNKGKEGAPVSVIMFIDFECPFSQVSSDIVSQMQKQYGSAVNIIFKHFPIKNIHPEATTAALAATCAGEQQKFWEYYDALFDEDKPLEKSTYPRIAHTIGLDQKQFVTCLASQTYNTVVEKDLKDGISLGVQGTPTYFVNDKKIEGVPTLEQWSTYILSAMKK